MLDSIRDSSAPRLVLDTNVVLDVFVFADAVVAELHRALLAAEAIWLSDDACRAEFARVLAYPQFALSEAAMAGALAHYDRLSSLVPPGPPPGNVRIPRCSDADDQKFLDLAFRGGADLLVTKDRALLKLARQTRDKLRIVAPHMLSSPSQGLRHTLVE